MPLAVANRNADQRKAEVTFLKGMTLAELSAFCSGVLVANGAVMEGEWTRPVTKERNHRRRPVVRLCECRRFIPPPGPKGGHPRKFCSPNCPVRKQHRKTAAQAA